MGWGIAALGRDGGGRNPAAGGRIAEENQVFFRVFFLGGAVLAACNRAIDVNEEA